MEKICQRNTRREMVNGEIISIYFESQVDDLTKIFQTITYIGLSYFSSHYKFILFLFAYIMRLVVYACILCDVMHTLKHTTFFVCDIYPIKFPDEHVFQKYGFDNIFGFHLFLCSSYSINNTTI